MRDYWLTQYFLQVIGWGYLALTVLALVAAIWLPKQRWAKLAGAVGVLALASILPLQGHKQYEQDKQAAEDIKLRQAKARSLFEERCKTAGERIYKTAEKVEGVYLVKIRKTSDTTNQFERNDPAGDRAHDAGYIQSFFMGRSDDAGPNGSFLLTHKNRRGAYRFVEVPAGESNRVVRYTDQRPVSAEGTLPEVRLQEEIVQRPAARYAIDWQDISTPQDRNEWIAGSRILVTDLQTNELLAERIGYVFDPALGDKSGGRQPWAYAAYTACPGFPRLHGQYPHQWGLTRNFAELVLKPVGGE